MNALSWVDIVVPCLHRSNICGTWTLNARSGVLLAVVGEEDFVVQVDDAVDEREEDDEAWRLRGFETYPSPESEHPATTSDMLLDFRYSSEVLAGVVVVRDRRTSRLPDLLNVRR